MFLNEAFYHFIKVILDKLELQKRCQLQSALLM